MNKNIVNIIKEEPFIGKDGKNYIKVTKEISIPRKTYLKGTISGKYRGNKMLSGEELHNSSLFDFEIYEAEVKCDSQENFRKNKPFKLKSKTVFPKNKLPQTLEVIIISKNKSFGINILEPQLYDFTVDRKLHQTDGDEIFGTFNAKITGFIFDYEKEIIEEIVLVPIVGIVEPMTPKPVIIRKPCAPNGIQTGKTERKGSYIRKEYLCKNHNDKIWGNWEYIESNKPTEGCFPSILGILALIFGIIFILIMLPGLLYIIPFVLFLIILNILSPYLKWIFRILGLILLFAFIAALINTFYNSSHRYIPPPLVVDSPLEVNPVIIPVIDDVRNTNEKDTIITHYRIWRDYDGNQYEGRYHLRLSDLKNSNYYKNNLHIPQDNVDNYDKVIFSLKENDKNKLNGVYKLFDSINNANKLSKIKFAEMVVSFVQDIPYFLILDNGCDANLYNDPFTRKYLSNPEALCDGYQKYGINTPVEFLYSLKGDCDTRTLLLYSIFSHYNYDVALLSSEFYGHSILGINLPINGYAYIYNNQRYLMWETTALNCKPGIIPNEISNLNNWRISLKSK